MSLLAGTLYDPAASASVATSALLPMTAVDTTNLRHTFTVPSNGAVAVKMHCVNHGGTTTPSIMLGVLESSTVKARHVPSLQRCASGNTQFYAFGSAFVVTGLTPSASLTWDAAYAVEKVVASSGIKFGGANDTTANNAFGGFAYEIWEASNLLAAVNYDPASADTSKSVATAAVMAALDTTNCRASFTTPASGAGSSKVLVRCRIAWTNSTSFAVGHAGILDGATVKARFGACGVHPGTIAATDLNLWEGSGIVSVSPNTSYDWDLAYGVETVASGGTLIWGGPDTNSTGGDAGGAAVLEVWKAA